jgi:hypothetical protein
MFGSPPEEPQSASSDETLDRWATSSGFTECSPTGAVTI